MIVRVGLSAITKDEVLKELACVAYKYKKIKDESVFLEALLEREAAFSTGCGSGIAIPHGKSSTVREHGIILFKLKESVEWHAIDDLFVDIVIGLLIPEDYFDEECLTSLAKLARALVDEAFRNKLRSLDEEVGIKEMVQEVMK